MSHFPPYGGPPSPYGYGQPPQQPGYAYVPVPIYPQQQQHPDPVHSQPTHVTNVYYQNPEPVHVVDHAPLPPVAHDQIDWVPVNPSSAARYAHRAVVAGKEGWDGSPLWVIRAHHSGDLIPGKLAAKHRSAYIAHAGNEVPVHNFELLCAPQHAVRWVPSSNGQVPPGAIPAGNTYDGEPLYIGRAHYMRSITPGKVHPSHGCLYMSFGGKEVPHKNYEVLCTITTTPLFKKISMLRQRNHARNPFLPRLFKP